MERGVLGECPCPTHDFPGLLAPITGSRSCGCGGTCREAQAPPCGNGLRAKSASPGAHGPIRASGSGQQRAMVGSSYAVIVGVREQVLRNFVIQGISPNFPASQLTSRCGIGWQWVTIMRVRPASR